MKNVSVFNEKGINVDKRNVHKVLKFVSDDLSIRFISMEFNFVSPETIIRINKEYLGHNYGTDIITFDYSAEKNMLDGEIFISLQNAQENSKKYRVSVDNELLRLIIHGILHLVGYDDVTLGKRKRMKIEENRLVGKFKKYSKGLVVIK